MLITPLLLLFLPLARICASVATDPYSDRFSDLSRHRASEENLGNSPRRFQASRDYTRAISKPHEYRNDRSSRLHGIKPEHEPRVGSINSELEDQQKLQGEEEKHIPVSRTEKSWKSWKDHHDVSSAFRKARSIPQVNAKGFVRLGEDRGELRRRGAQPQAWYNSTINPLHAATGHPAGQHEEASPERTPEHTVSRLDEVRQSITTPSASEPTPTPPLSHSPSPALATTPAGSRAFSEHPVSRTYVEAQTTGTVSSVNRVSSKFGTEDPSGNNGQSAGGNCWIPSRCRPGQHLGVDNGLANAQGANGRGTTGRNAVQSRIAGGGSAKFGAFKPSGPISNHVFRGSGSRMTLPTGYVFSNSTPGRTSLEALEDQRQGPNYKVPAKELVPWDMVNPNHDKGVSVKTPKEGPVPSGSGDTKGQGMLPGNEGDKNGHKFQPTALVIESRLLDGLVLDNGLGFYLKPTRFESIATDDPAPTASATSRNTFLHKAGLTDADLREIMGNMPLWLVSAKNRQDRNTDPNILSDGSEIANKQLSWVGRPMKEEDILLPDTDVRSDRPQPSSPPRDGIQQSSPGGEGDGSGSRKGEGQPEGGDGQHSTAKTLDYQQGATFKDQFFSESKNPDLVPPGTDGSTDREPAPKGTGGSDYKGQDGNAQPSRGVAPNAIPPAAKASGQPSSGDDNATGNGKADGGGVAKFATFNPKAAHNFNQVFKAESTPENAALVPSSGSEPSSLGEGRPTEKPSGSQSDPGQSTSDSTLPPADREGAPITANAEPNFSNNPFANPLFRGGAVQPSDVGSAGEPADPDDERSNPESQRSESGNSSSSTPSIKTANPPDRVLAGGKEGGTKNSPATEIGKASSGNEGGNPSSQAEGARPSTPSPASAGLRPQSLGRPTSDQPSMGSTEQGSSSTTSENPGSAPPQGATSDQREYRGAAGNDLSNFDNNQITAPIFGTEQKDSAVSSNTPSGGRGPSEPPLVGGNTVQKAPNGDIEVGSVRIPEGKSAIVEGHTLSNVPAAVAIDGQDIPLPLPVSTDPFFGSAPSINGQPIERLPNGDLQIGSITVPPNMQQEIQGHVLANKPSAAVLDGSSYPYNPTPTPSPPVVGGQPVVRKPDGDIVIGSTTISPGEQAEVSGHTISNFPAAAVIDGSPFPISATPTNPPLPLLDGQQVKKDDKDNLMVGSGTIAPTAESLVGGHTISNIPSGALIDGTTYAATTPAPGQATPVLGTLPPAVVSKLPIYDPVAPSATQVPGAQLPGGIPAATDLLTLAPPTAMNNHIARLAIAGTPVRALPSASGAVAIGTVTIAPGQETSVAGASISLGPSEIKVDGTAFPFAPSQTAFANVAVPTITSAPKVRFDLKTNGDVFTIAVPQGEEVHVKALSAALPGASFSVDTAAGEVVVDGFRLPSATTGTTNPTGGYGNRTRVVEEQISSSVDAAFTPTATPTAGAGDGSGEELLVLIPNRVGGVLGYGIGAVLTSTVASSPTLTTMVTSVIGTDGSLTGANAGEATANGMGTGSAGSKLRMSGLRVLLWVLGSYSMLT